MGARWDSLRCPYPAAYARWRQSEALAEQGRRSAAAEVLESALGIAVGLNATLLQAELETLARRARLVVPSISPAANLTGRAAERFGVTAREREVLAELANGASNRRIARALFITEKTASVHVSNIMAKLGAANRGEAAALAHRFGLVPASDKEAGSR